MLEELRPDPLRYQVAQLADEEIARRAADIGFELDGRREEAALIAVAGLMDGTGPEDPDLPISRLAQQAQEAILARAREPGHGDLVLDLLLSHRFRRHLEDKLPEHTIQRILAFRRLERRRHRRGRRR
jgi:hypothetical protein